MLIVKKINILEFREIAHDFDKLLNNSIQNNIFLTHEWLISWWSVWGKESQSYILTIEDNNRLVGLAPLMIKTQRWLGLLSIRVISFINSEQVAADHIDFISYKGYERLVNDVIYDHLKQNSRRWDVLSLENIPSDSLTLENTKTFKFNFLIYKSIGELCPYLTLSGDWKSLLENKSSKFRKKIRYRNKNFKLKLAGVYKHCETKQQINLVLQQLVKLNPERWNKQGKLSSFSDILFQKFHLDIAQKFLSKEWLDLSYLEVDSQIVAVIYNYIYANKLYFYNTAFDPKFAHSSVGRILLEYSIEYAFEKKLDEFDFLRGVHSYKNEWCTDTIMNENLLIIKSNTKMRIWYALRTIKKKLIKLIKKVFTQSFCCKLKLYLQKICDLNVLKFKKNVADNNRHQQ